MRTVYNDWENIWYVVVRRGFLPKEKAEAARAKIKNFDLDEVIEVLAREIASYHLPHGEDHAASNVASFRAAVTNITESTEESLRRLHPEMFIAGISQEDAVLRIAKALERIAEALEKR